MVLDTILGEDGRIGSVLLTLLFSTDRRLVWEGETIFSWQDQSEKGYFLQDQPKVYWGSVLKVSPNISDTLCK